MRVLGIIPARLESTRLPRKLLLRIGGKALLQHVWEAARRARLLDRLVIATDSLELERAARDFGAEVERTSSKPRSGSERCAEVAQRLQARVVINIQGDEFGVRPAMVDALARTLLDHPRLALATLSQPLTRPRDWHDPAVVKVVTNRRGQALYFSRAPIPYGTGPTVRPGLRRHIGLYGYRRPALLNLARRPPTPLEQLEGLEQLRALENGWIIQVVPTRQRSEEINTWADLRRVRRQRGRRAAHNLSTRRSR
ncbi:MAG TPA: 3-deoxy-manno-octulosonate cytidylyltransferase [Acidobacteriota bacterium]|jgi:3-deoxy-manno-octulosonate cytidylyltransferase (CMP-KDO synthetase)